MISFYEDFIFILLFSGRNLHEPKFRWSFFWAELTHTQINLIIFVGWNYRSRAELTIVLFPTGFFLIVAIFSSGKNKQHTTWYDYGISKRYHQVIKDTMTISIKFQQIWNLLFILKQNISVTFEFGLKAI